MKKKIQFSLVYRDMWQSSGKFQPRKDQLERIAPAIIDMGCFSRVETNGGAFEQVNLLAGENPNDAVRAFCKPFNEVGIKTHMLDRGLNALRMYPVPDDVRRLMYKVKHAQGVDIPRIFCGLNDVRNIIPSVKWALEAGMTPQATLCITTSPIHTVEYYSDIADQVIAAGAQEICLKDMAGIGQPAMLGKLTKAIKTKHPDVIIQYHGHSGPGLSMASILEVCNNGGDVIDTAIEPLSWGKVHPDIISVQSMLKNEGFEVAEINMNAYMQARTLTQEFIDEWLGYFINPGNKQMSSLLLGCGLPGGMMGQGHWIIEMSEMIATANAKSIEEIKSFLSKQKETYKVPYETHPADRLRQCVFAGTTNRQDFLPRDRTGNRRFIPVPVDAELAEVHILDNEEGSRSYIDQLWAEAMTIYNSGDYKLAFSPAMQETLQAHQQDFMQEDAQAGMIYAFLEDYTGDRVCSKQLYAEALGNTNIPAEWETRAICEIMNTGISRGDIQGWQAHKTAKRYPKYGVQKGWERVTSPETGAEDFSEITDAEAQQLGFPF